MPGSRRRVLVINLGWEQQRLVDLVFELDCDVVGVHPELGAVADRPYLHLERADPRDLGAILSVAERFEVDAAVADQCDYAHFAAALVCETRSLPGPRVRAAQRAASKLLSREVTQAAGIRVPPFRRCSCPEDAEEAARAIGFPVVVKPVDNRGSFGVSVVRDPDALRAAVLSAIVHSHSRLFLVEGFVAGTNVIAEGYCFVESGHQTLAVGSKEHLPTRPQIHTSVVFPGELEPAIRERVVATNQRVVAALGLKQGMTSAEYVVDAEGEPWLMEIANRGGGVLISSVIVPHVSGVDTTRQLVFDALGLRRDLFAEREEVPSRAAYLGYLVFEPGRVQAVQGVDDLASDEAVLAARYWGVRSGRVELPSDALGRQGMFIVAGTDARAARAQAQRVAEKVRVAYV